MDAQAAKAAADKAYVDAQNAASVARGQLGSAQAKYEQANANLEVKKATPLGGAGGAVEGMSEAIQAQHDTALNVANAASQNIAAIAKANAATAARDNADAALNAAMGAADKAGADLKAAKTGAVLHAVLLGGGIGVGGAPYGSGPSQPGNVVYYPAPVTVVPIQPATPLMVTPPGAATPTDPIEPIAPLVENPGAVGMTVSIKGAAAAIPQEQRYLQIRNDTGQPVTIWVQYYTRTDQGQWAWFPADPAKSSKGIAYEIGAGETLGHQSGTKTQSGTMTASRIRFWVKSEAGEWAQYKDQDAWLVPEVDKEGRHAYLAKEMEIFPLQLSP